MLGATILIFVQQQSVMLKVFGSSPLSMEWQGQVATPQNGDRREKVQEAYTAHWYTNGRTFPGGKECLILRTMFFQDVENPASTIRPYTWPCPTYRCPIQTHLTNTTLSRSAIRAQVENGALFFSDSCFRLILESKHMWEVTKAPTPSWASLGSGRGAPGLRLTFLVTQLTIQSTFLGANEDKVWRVEKHLKTE